MSQANIALLIFHDDKYYYLQKDRRLLIGGMKARKILLATPILKWYISHGMKVTNVYQVVEFTPKRCFKSFEEEVTAARRVGDTDPAKMIIADTMKLIGNSAYGSLIMDKEKHRTVKYVLGKDEACKCVNQPVFRKLSELDDDLYEIESAKKSIKLDLPIYLGYFILQYAKLRMLEYYYDCLDKILDRADYQYLEMDTDSAYISISGDSLHDVVKPEEKYEFQRLLTGICTDSIQGEVQWFPRECCSKHILHDKRTPGLFKLEAEGDEMIALSSKTYLLKNKEVLKIVCKGLNEKFLEDPLSLYFGVLTNQSSKCGTNRGFVSKNNTIYTYEQSRAGLTYFYIKRDVLCDGTGCSSVCK